MACDAAALPTVGPRQVCDGRIAHEIAVASTLRRGGLLAWSAPLFSQIHGSPQDFWRFTPEGAKTLAEAPDQRLRTMKTQIPSLLHARILRARMSIAADVACVADVRVRVLEQG